MRRGWVRLAASAAIFGVLVWRLGTGPFLDGVRTVDGRALAAAAGLALVTTVACAWRWKIVASGLGVQLSLPGGVVGDVHRGVSHGRDVSDVPRALRGVAWERLAGQAVQAVVTVAVLLALPSPVQSSMPLIAIAAVAVAACVVLAARAHGRFWRAAVADIRDGLLARRAWLGVALASAVVVVGHAATFVIAARTAGVTEPTSRLLPLALLVMLIGVVPSVAGWGPREGGAAWVFAAAGLGAHLGVTTAVAYGVMALVASLPGAAVLVVSWCRRTRLPVRAESRRRGSSTCLSAHTPS